MKTQSSAKVLTVASSKPLVCSSAKWLLGYSPSATSLKRQLSGPRVSLKSSQAAARDSIALSALEKSVMLRCNLDNLSGTSFSRSLAGKARRC